jgi:anti-anti-sigma factor
MQKLTITINSLPEIPNAQIVHFDGDFDGYAKENITDLQKTIDECAAGAVLIFDFAKLNYLNSFAIGQLVAWHNAVNTKGGKILIVGINKNVEDIFSVLGINNIFKAYATIEELKQDLKA